MIPQEDRIFLEEIASGVKMRRLAVPATVFMESVYPLRRVLNSCMDLLYPMFSLLISEAKWHQFQQVLAQPERFDYFLKQLEK